MRVVKKAHKLEPGDLVVFVRASGDELREVARVDPIEGEWVEVTWVGLGRSIHRSDMVVSVPAR